MRRMKWLSICVSICLLCAAFGTMAMAEEVVCPPVDEAVGEAGPVELGYEPEGDAPLETRDESQGNAQRNDESDFVIVDGVLTRYLGLSNSIAIPETVTRLGAGVFEGDKRLTSVYIPESVTCIEEKAFYDCDKLTNVSIPDSVTEIGNNAFASCDSLKTLVLPKGLKSIESKLFWFCAKLESITIPGSVATVGSGAFGSCSRLVSVVIEEGVTTIEDAFNNCASLESVAIPASVTKINRTAFNNCDNLVILGTEGSVAEQYAQLIEVPFNAPIISFDDQSIWLHIARTRTLKATQKPASLAGALAWSSSDESIVTVDQSGAIRAIRTGTAVVTAGTADGRGKSAQITISVPDLSSIKLSGDVEDCVPMGDTAQITASVNTPYAFLMDSPYTVAWKSSDDAVVAIDSSAQRSSNATATIRGTGVGKATVTATTEDGGTASIEIEVVSPDPTGIKIDQKGPIKMKVGEKLQLSATLTPKEAVSELDWYSSDEDVAVVSQKGVVTALEEGTTTISVETFNDCEDTIDIIVSAKTPTSVKLNKTGTVSLALGKTLQLKATVNPSDAKTKLTWKSSKAKVASVSSAGKVTSQSAGTTKITVKTSNGKKASVKVKVVAPVPKSVKITNGKKATLEVGKKLTLNTQFSPKNAESKLTWSTSDKKVAAVTSKGVVTAKAVGTATITVTTANGKKAEIEITVK